MSSAPRLSESSLTPNDLSSGRAGGGGPFFLGGCTGCAGCETVRALDAGLAFSTPSGTEPIVFFLPNQLLLFLRDSVGAWLLMVAGEPGLSDFKLSLDGMEPRPRNLRTEDGRLCGLVGDRVLLAASLDRGCNCSPSADSPLPFVASALCGKTADCGVGCDDSGPFPGVGGRGLSGGESGGAGIDVPSVSEKLMGVSVNGLYLLPAMTKAGGGKCCVCDCVCVVVAVAGVQWSSGRSN